jgi:hypothetical protein
MIDVHSPVSVTVTGACGNSLICICPSTALRRGSARRAASKFVEEMETRLLPATSVTVGLETKASLLGIPEVRQHDQGRPVTL